MHWHLGWYIVIPCWLHPLAVYVSLSLSLSFNFFLCASSAWPKCSFHFRRRISLSDVNAQKCFSALGKAGGKTIRPFLVLMNWRMLCLRFADRILFSWHLQHVWRLERSAEICMSVKWTVLWVLASDTTDLFSIKPKSIMIAFPFPCSIEEGLFVYWALIGSGS